MIFSKSSEYALRALVYLATLDSTRMATVEEISAHEQIPKHFLAKLLQGLARAGVLCSVKGPGGGFALAVHPAQVTLLDVIESVDGPVDFDRCAVGLDECTDSTPCPCHDEWTRLRESIRCYLSGNNLLTLQRALEAKRELHAVPQPSPAVRETFAVRAGP